MENRIKKYISKSPAKKHWEKVGIHPHHGVCIPLFSLRSKNSCGIGEYLDLIPMIDWCKKLNLNILQLLPLNETSIDFSPYNAISSCALDPIYITLKTLPYVAENASLKKMLLAFKKFTLQKRIAYSQIKKLKIKFLYLYFHTFFDRFKERKKYKNFIDKNRWLNEYAIFHILQDENGEKSWKLWPKNLKDITKKDFTSLLKKYSSKLYFYCFLQYLCYVQLSFVKSYASKNNVQLIGDIPILISPNSCDVWKNRSFFDLNFEAGAPPDDFQPLGQRWKFPLFNWDNLKKDNFSWWKRRLKVASYYYHLYRIDHVVGFFRIWAILPEEDPTQGRFLPANPHRWTKQGKSLLKMMLKGSPLLPLAEDLGLIPQETYDTLKELGIPGTRIVRWQRKDDQFISPRDYDPLSMTSLSTHDMDTVTLWWKKYSHDAKIYCQHKKWKYRSTLSFAQRKEILRESHHTSSLLHINLLSEYLALFPKLVWEDPEDERINIPGTELPINWTYRFKPFLEEFTSHKGLNKAICEILKTKHRKKKS